LYFAFGAFESILTPALNSEVWLSFIWRESLKVSLRIA